MNAQPNLKKLSDQKLLNSFSQMVRYERKATAHIVCHLAEIDYRRLYAKEGYSSLFAYIKDRYHYSGSSTYRRIQAARLTLRFPEIIDLLVSGKLNLQSICQIEPHLTRVNAKGLIQKVMGKTKEEIDYMLDQQFSRTYKTQDKIRRLPVIKQVVTKTVEIPEKETKPSGMDGKENHLPKKVTAAAALKSTQNKQFVHVKKVMEIRRVKLECVVDEKVASKLERAKEVLRAKFPKGRLEDVLNEALDALLEKKDPEKKMNRVKKGIKQEPKPQHRYIPTQLRRDIWKRDQGSCTFISHNGKRCHERGNLHLDHIRPFALGGTTEKENLRLLCRTHNLSRAEQTFGRMRSHGGRRSS